MARTARKEQTVRKEQIITPKRTPRIREVHSSDTKIEQKADIVNHEDYEGDIVLVDPALLKKEYAEELAFNEQPVTIRLERSPDKHSSTVFPVWNNGKPAEVFQNGRWEQIGYLPVGRNIIVKRKVLAIIAGAKVDTVQTGVIEAPQQDPQNVISRFTSAIHSFSVLEDKDPRGPAWLSELIRRNA